MYFFFLRFIPSESLTEEFNHEGFTVDVSTEFYANYEFQFKAFINIYLLTINIYLSTINIYKTFIDQQ